MAKMGKKRTEIVDKYNKKTYKQVIVRLKSEEYDKFLEAVNASGMSKNSFIVDKITQPHQ